MIDGPGDAARMWISQCRLVLTRHACRKFNTIMVPPITNDALVGHFLPDVVIQRGTSGESHYSCIRAQIYEVPRNIFSTLNN